MQRVTISIEQQLADRFDRLIEARGYQSRSKAMRDLIREAVEDARLDADLSANGVANLSYVFDRRTRSLAQRLSELRHAHHDLVGAVMQVHLDHHHTFENVMLSGPTGELRRFADMIGAERGVRFAKINLISVTPHDDHGDDEPHSHRGGGHLSPDTR
jgi:CopG family nickel-responsive transcriptional regulator